MGTPDDKTATSETNASDAGNNDNTGVDWEKRYKDTQAAYTKSQQTLKATSAKLEVLETLTTPKVELDTETQERLDELKYSNPDEWRKEMDKIEAKARAEHQAKINEAADAAALESELERRDRVLEEFNRANGFEITDENIKYDLPLRITQQLENGEVTFEQFLENAYKYLNTPKRVGDGNEVMGQPDLGSVGGGDSASDYTAAPDSVASYRTEIY